MTLLKNKDLVHFLNQTLSNYFVMFVKLHRYHWFVKGNNFFTLHEKFEEMYNTFVQDIDIIVERILMIEGKPYATMEKFLKYASFVEASADDEERQSISRLKEDFEHLVQEIKDKGIPAAEEVGDEPTIDMLIGFQSKLEKYLWMLKAYLL